jgi:hypothetical protein
MPTENVVSCPRIDAFGFDSDNLIGWRRAAILPPTSRPKWVKAFCQSCFAAYVKEAQEAGDEVHQGEQVENVWGVKRSCHRLDQ